MGTVKYSGPVASFHCPTNAEIRSLKVHFSPKQEGSGDPSPENVREIVGWDGVEVQQRGKNIGYITKYSASSVSTPTGYASLTNSYGTTINTTAYTYPKGELIITQSNYSNSIVNNYQNGYVWINCNYLNFGAYYDISLKISNITNNPLNVNLNALRLCPPQGSQYVPFLVSNNIVLFKNVLLDHHPISLQQQGFDLRICGLSFTLSDVMITPSGLNDQIFEPYQGSTTNYEFGVLGKNKLDEQKYADITNYPNPGSYGYKYTDPIILAPNTTYTFSFTPRITDYETIRYWAVKVYDDVYEDINDTGIVKYLVNGTYCVNYSITTGKKGAIRFAVYGGQTTLDEIWDRTTVQMELGSTATAYEPYDPNHTVYGGWVDLISGEVVQTYKLVDLGTLSYSYRSDLGGGIFCAYTTQTTSTNRPKDNWKGICSKYPYVGAYSKLTNLTQGVGFVYNEAVAVKDTSITIDDPAIMKASLDGVILACELRNPVSYQLSSIELQTFLGQNNVWSNADYVEVEYDLHETQDILARKQFIVANQPHIVKPAAAPLQNFVTDVAAPLKECKVYFSPVQEGTGDPSPDNVRAITGWIGVEVEQRNKNLLSNYENGYFHTFIPAETKLVASSDIPTSGHNQVRFYRADKTEIDYWTLTETYTDNRRKRGFTPHEDCYYWRFNNNDLNVQLELGSTATAYEPYTGTTFPITFPITTNLLTKTTLTANSTLSSEGAVISETGMSVTNFIKVAEGEQYTLTFTSKEGARTRRIYGYDSSKQPAQSLASTSWVSVDTKGTITATVPSGVEYIRVCYKTADEDIFLEGPESSVIYGGYMDLVNGEVVAEYIQRIYDGSSDESWALSGSDTYVCHQIDARNDIRNIRPICDKFYMEMTYGTNYRIRPIGNKIYANTVAEWREWLAQNPIQVVYELAEPIHYSLTTETLKTLRGTNNLYSNSNGNIELAYWSH